MEFTLIEASFEEGCSCEVMLLPLQKENDGHTWYFGTLYTVKMYVRIPIDRSNDLQTITPKLTLHFIKLDATKSNTAPD